MFLYLESFVPDGSRRPHLARLPPLPLLSHSALEPGQTRPPGVSPVSPPPFVPVSSGRAIRAWPALLALGALIDDGDDGDLGGLGVAAAEALGSNVALLALG